MAPSSNKPSDSRRVKIDELRARQQATERKRSMIFVGPGTDTPGTSRANYGRYDADVPDEDVEALEGLSEPEPDAI